LQKAAKEDLLSKWSLLKQFTSNFMAQKEYSKKYSGATGMELSVVFNSLQSFFPPILHD
jgi:hypothetical protein